MSMPFKTLTLQQKSTSIRTTVYRLIKLDCKNAYACLMLKISACILLKRHGYAGELGEVQWHLGLRPIVLCSPPAPVAYDYQGSLNFGQDVTE